MFRYPVDVNLFATTVIGVAEIIGRHVNVSHGDPPTRSIIIDVNLCAMTVIDMAEVMCRPMFVIFEMFSNCVGRKQGIVNDWRCAWYKSTPAMSSEEHKR